MFYQSDNSMLANLWKTESGTNLSFPPHLHSSFEWITVTEGELQITVEQTTYTLQAGKAMLIFPNQVHTFHTPVHSRHFLCIFSPKLVQAYSKNTANKLPLCNLYVPTAFYVNAMLRAQEAQTYSDIQIKGLLYSLCGEFDAQAEYTERKPTADGLLAEIFQFVEQNYNKDCSLSALSAHTGYHYVYLSHYFKQCTGLSFTDYVIRYRVNEAIYLLKNTEQTVLQTAYDCGFDSLRSFNRNFKRTTSLTPQEYRERKTP